MQSRNLALGILLSFTAVAQPGTPAQENQPATGYNLRVDTTLVEIPVAVTDSLNRFVLGLQKEDFHLFEDRLVWSSTKAAAWTTS
jgi:hypothetical protein